jgi:hypothetical protein
MLSFSSVPVGVNEERGEYYYRVQSSKCWYQVNVLPSVVRILGPGVDETFDRGEDLPDGLSLEGLVLVAVITFEEQES